MYAGLKLKNTAILKAFGVFLSSLFSSAAYSQQTFVNAIDVDFWPTVDEQYQSINEQDCKFKQLFSQNSALSQITSDHEIYYLPGYISGLSMMRVFSDQGAG